MDISTLLIFISNNFTPLLTAITVLSFIFNIIQWKTNRDVQYHLDTIYQTCLSTIQVNSKEKQTTSELINIIFVIRTQSVSALRSLGIKRSYGAYDATTTQGVVYRFLASSYRTMLAVKRQWPVLFGKESHDSDKDSGSRN